MITWLKKWGEILIPDFIWGLGTVLYARHEAREAKRGEAPASGERPSAGHTAGVLIGRALSLNRAQFLRELHRINAATGGRVQAIIDLLEVELEWNSRRHGRFVVVNGKRYWEEKIVRKLLSIQPEYRAAEYVRLNRLLADKKTRPKFFAELEVLHNDGLFQWIGEGAEFSKEFYEDHLEARLHKAQRAVQQTIVDWHREDGARNMTDATRIVNARTRVLEADIARMRRRGPRGWISRWVA